MKKLSIRMRLTLLSSILLTLACIILTIALNRSASDMVDVISATKLLPTSEMPDYLPMVEIEAAAQQELFRNSSITTMILVVLCGSAITYFLVGHALKPLQSFTWQIQSKNISNLHKKIPLPQVKDELFALSEAFNEMSDKLQASFELQKRFSANAAHELRTPLTIMQAKLDVFLLTNTDPETDKILKELSGQSERLANLVDDLLLFSKDLPLEQTGSVNLHLLISDLVEELAELADEKNILFEIQDTECSVLGNDALLERVFYNILQNALKYSDDHSKVRIDFTKFETKTIVTVSDMGQGIPDEDKEHIFELFYRVDPSRSKHVVGNGLGLAISKKILDRHGASILVRDNIPYGSVFEISFPS